MGRGAGEAEGEAAMLGALLDAGATAVVLAGPASEIVYTNQRARELLTDTVAPGAALIEAFPFEWRSTLATVLADVARTGAGSAEIASMEVSASLLPTLPEHVCLFIRSVDPRRAALEGELADRDARLRSATEADRVASSKLPNGLRGSRSSCLHSGGGRSCGRRCSTSAR